MRCIDLSYRAGTETWLYPLDLTLTPGTLTTLLGATAAGKTTLLRVLAGLDRPTTGRVLSGNCDLTGVPVRERNVAMVYQQFINYPSLSVFENIASPLRVKRLDEKSIRTRVSALAETLHLTPFLDRYPAELSGGQQQRTAMARALAKDAELLLLDEPLANLDYKLREELRTELRQLFATSGTTVVYATTEPQEALQLGNSTILLTEGRLVAHGPTLDLFRRPQTLEAAHAFSDPPLNEIPARVDTARAAAILSGEVRVPLSAAALASMKHDGELVIGIRPHRVSVMPTTTSVAIDGHVELAEISGSETYLHVRRDSLSVVAHLPGVHTFGLREPCTIYIDPADVYCFDMQGRLLAAPENG